MKPILTAQQMRDMERAYFDAYMTEALADGTLDGGIPLPEPNA